METKFQGYQIEPPDPDFEYLVRLSEALVPIAHIKIIGDVETGLSFIVDDDGGELPMYGFRIMLTDANLEDPSEVGKQILFESWETIEDAEEERRALAMQVDNYYKRLLGDKKGGS